MLTVLKDEANRVAEKTGWTYAFSAGFLAGELHRTRGSRPPLELLCGTDEYAVGMQIGFHYGTDYLKWGDGS